MSPTQLMVYFIGIVGLLAALLALVSTKERTKPADYRGMFWVGVIFFVLYAVDLIVGGLAAAEVFLLLGAVYAGLALANIEKWAKPPVLPVGQRYMLIGLTMAGALTVFIVTAVHWLAA